MTTLTFALCAMAASALDIDSTAIGIAARNPGVEAARQRYEAEIQTARATNVLAGPEIDFDYKFNSRSGEPNRWGFSVGQGFDWPGVYGKRRQATGYRARAYADLYRAELLDMALAAKQALISVAVARQQVMLLEEASHNIMTLYEAYDAAYARGDATVLEVSKFRLRRFELNNRLAEAEAALESSEARLKMLGGKSGDVPDMKTVIAQISLHPLSRYQELLEANDPSVAARRSLTAADAADVSAARRAMMPSLRLAYTHDYEDFTHFNGFSVGLSLPSWSGRNAMKAARAAETAGRLEAEDYALKINAKLISDHSRAMGLYRRVKEGHNVFDTGDYPALLHKALDMKRLTIYEYCTEYDSYLTAKSDFITLCGTLADLAAQLGKWEMQ